MNNTKEIIEDLKSNVSCRYEQHIVELIERQQSYIENLESRVSDLEYENKPDSEKFIS